MDPGPAVVGVVHRSGDGLPAECGSAWREKLGLKPATVQGGGGPESINEIVLVGEKGDTAFLLSGISGAEDWSKLPGAAFGAGVKHTVRWTPGAGTETKMIVPVAPGKAHIITIAGNAAWPNQLEVIVNGKSVGTVEIKAGDNKYEVTAPAEAIGLGQVAMLTLRYATARSRLVRRSGLP